MKVAVIGGSGLGMLLAGTAHATPLQGIDTPFGAPSDLILESNWSGVPVYFLNRHGSGHRFNPSEVPYRANIFALKQLGVTHILATGAVGSLREEFKPQHLVIPDQVIDQTFHRASTFFDSAAVHVEMAEPFCPVLRQTVLHAAGLPLSAATNSSGEGKPLEPTLHDRGCYLAMEGPAFSTRAESLMHRLWGADLVGMTAMPEARLAREAEISYAMIAMVTDFDSWRRPPATALQGVSPTSGKDLPAEPSMLIKEIQANLQAVSARAYELLQTCVTRMAESREALMEAPSLHALAHAIWSDKSKIDSAEIERLRPLWGRYF